MTKKIAKQIKTLTTYQTADTQNYEGFPAWNMPLEKRFRQVLFTGTFGNAFYVKQQDVIKEGIQVIKEGIEKLPMDYVVFTIVSARNEGFIRTAPIVALILLREKDKNAFKEIFNKVIITGNDMEDFMRLSRALGKGFGRAVKSAMKEWLKSVNEFYAIKYKRQVADTMRVARPDWNSPILDYVASSFKEKDIKGIIDKLPQIKAFEEAKDLLSQGKIKEAIKYIREGKVPATALIGVISTEDPEYWRALAEQMGTMQLLKYINKLLSVGVDEEYIKERINVTSLKKAKILPFRLAIASRYIRDKKLEDINLIEKFILDRENSKLEEIEEIEEIYSPINSIRKYLLKVAVDYAKEYNWKKWEGKWVVCPDVSGSMTSGRNDIRPADIASIFAGILKAGLRESKILAWDNDIYDYSNMEPIKLVRTISNANGGGTYMEKPIEYMIKNKIDADYVLFITDSEEWGKGWLKYWKKYKKNHPNTKVIFIRVDPYKTQPYSVEDELKYDIYDVFGWNDSVLSWIEEFVL